MDLSKATDQELLSEITSRLAQEPERPDGLIKPVIVDVPAWMRDAAYAYQDGDVFRGDASKACGAYFHWMIGQRSNSTAQLSIICPTFLRGPLSFNFNSRQGKLLSFGSSY